ncbi:MAG: hypothetical protein IIW17_02490 [Clostridia bacterium]|jgi:hypothetical protein|nr:hypothetical protein [Clostridia bacterium]MBQ5792866.1 hypothetical protein [Clostridia bacterium]
MKAYARITDHKGNEQEIELNELAIFANCEEIQELIEFLTYVKADHLVQHRHNLIAVTHNHFNMWKGEQTGNLDLQIWSTSDDCSKSNDANQ